MANRPATIMTTTSWVPEADGLPQCQFACGKKNPGGGTSCGGNGNCAKCWSLTQNGKTSYACYPLNYTPNDVDSVSRPTTAAALLSTVGSPQQDVFERGSSQFITVGHTIWNLASAEDNRCSCNRGRNTGCNLCGVDRNRCYSILPIHWQSEGGGVWKFTVLQSFFTCIVDRRDPNSGQLYPWPDGEYLGDPRLGHSRPDDQTVVYGYRVAESFRRGNGWQSIPISQL